MSVSVTNHGFTLDGTNVTWESVHAIATYKHDLFAYDDICLAFKASDDSWIVTHQPFAMPAADCVH